MNTSITLVMNLVALNKMSWVYRNIYTLIMEYIVYMEWTGASIALARV